MRIGMILDKIFPPDPRVENEALTLINDGHQVFLFCLTYKGDRNKPRQDVKGIKVCRYTSNKLEYKLSALAYTVPFYTNSMFKKIAEFISENSIEVLHIHDLQIAAAAFKANEQFKLPTVLDLHENRPEIMKYYKHLQKFPGKYLIHPGVWKQKEEEFGKQASKVVLVTNEAKKELCNRVSIAEDNVVVVPNTVSSSFFKQEPLTTDFQERYKANFVLLYIGDTGLRRGLITAIEAVSKLKNSIQNIKLVIVGSSNTDAILKQKAMDLGVEDIVDFEGWKDEGILSSYINASDVCISPLHRNLHHDTTYANKIFQYMSFAKPVLVSNVTAQKNIVEDHRSGLVHMAENVDDFVSKVLELYQEENMRRALGENGKRFVENQFVWEKTSKDLLNMYKELAQ